MATEGGETGERAAAAGAAVVDEQVEAGRVATTAVQEAQQGATHGDAAEGVTELIKRCRGKSWCVQDA